MLTVVENIPLEASRLQSIKTTTARDEDLCQLQNIIQNGWPDNKSNVPLELHEYWSCGDELSVADGLILRQNCHSTGIAFNHAKATPCWTFWC